MQSLTLDSALHWPCVTNLLVKPPVDMVVQEMETSTLPVTKRSRAHFTVVHTVTYPGVC